QTVRKPERPVEEALADDPFEQRDRESDEDAGERGQDHDPIPMVTDASEVVGRREPPAQAVGVEEAQTGLTLSKPGGPSREARNRDARSDCRSPRPARRTT